MGMTPTDTEIRLRALLDDLWREVCSRPALPAGAHLATAEPDARGLRFDAACVTRPGRDLPVLSHLPAALSAARAAGFAVIADALAALGHQVPWTQSASYTEAKVGAHFMANYAYGLLSGPEGPLICTHPYAGFLLLGPDLLYRDHRHAPREVYLLLTPGAEWRLDGGDWFPVAAGDVVLHRSWQPHATRVGTTPLLAFVAWLDPADRGGIDI